MPARLPVLRVGAPCPLRWEDMAGDDRTRFCGKCQQHVYNVESLTPDEVRALVQQREGRVCVRLRRRSDGTMITRDCWYVVRRARERLAATVMGVAVAAAGFWGGVGVLSRWFGPGRAPVAACPEPLPPRANLPEIPEPAEIEEPGWLAKQLRNEQGGRSRLPKVRRKSRPRPIQPPVYEEAIMGDMVISD
jgi:hypothetical protein